MDLDRLRWAVEILQNVKHQKAALKELEEQARDAVQEAMGDADSGTLDGREVITWKAHKRTALDQKLLKSAYPDVFDLCRTTTEVRRFEVAD